jgi:hypothetical protein
MVRDTDGSWYWWFVIPCLWHASRTISI